MEGTRPGSGADIFTGSSQGDTVMTRYAVGHRKGGAVVGAVWMLLISLLLFWLPLFGPLIAGFVGGKKAGGIGPALGAVFLPAAAIGFLFFVLFTVTGFPLIGVLTGGAAFLTVAAGMIGPLLLGAIVGGAMA